MPPVKAAHTTLVTTDTSAASLVVGGANGGSTTGTGGIKGGQIALTAGIAIDGGTITDHGIVMPSAVPAVTTMALYNNSGTLTWNGSALAAGSSVSGTIGRLSKFTAANALGDSIMAESGTTITVTGTLNATTALQVAGVSINTGGTLSNVAYLDQANTFTAAGGQKFTGGISVSAGTQSTAGIMIPSATPGVLTTVLYNDGGSLTWTGGGMTVVGTLTIGTGLTDGSGTLAAYTWASTRYGGATDAPTLTVNKSRGNSGAATIVSSGDTLYTLTAKGYDGAAFQSAASIAAFVDGTPGSGDMPGRLVFSTSADGTASPAEAMRLTAAGLVGIGTSATTVSARLHVIHTTQQLRLGFDASNYCGVTVASNGATTFAATGGGAFTFSQAVTGSAGFVGNLTGNVTGNASGTAATVTTAAQPAITSLGTLTTLSVSGTVTLSDDTTLASSKKLYFGAGSDTWLGETTVNQLDAQAGGAGGCFIASGGTTWTAVSDERAKVLIDPITSAMDRLRPVRTVIGRYKTDAVSTRRPFLIAQDWQTALPEAVTKGADGTLGLSYELTVPLVIAALQEVDARLRALED